jgi:hypothetical protein
MADPTGEAERGALRLDSDCRLMLRFCGSVITVDGGLPAYRELDDVLALTTGCLGLRRRGHRAQQSVLAGWRGGEWRASLA